MRQVFYKNACLLCFIFVYYYMIQERKSKWAIYTLLLAVITLGSSCNYHIRKRPQKLFSKVIANAQSYDVGIIPGYPFDGQRWDTLMKARLLWAKILYQKGIVRNFIVSGGAVHSPYVEAEYMKRYAVALGIPAEHVFTETRAQHSVENIFYSYEMARTLGFKSIALCTDPLQSILTKRFTFRRFETDIQHLPIIYDSLLAYNNLDPVIDTHALRAPDAFIPLKDRKSRWQSFRGTLGAGLPWEGKRLRPAL